MIFALQIVHELIVRASQKVDSFFVSIANAKASADHLTKVRGDAIALSGLRSALRPKAI
jgi:hypothetical protein